MQQLNENITVVLVVGLCAIVFGSKTASKIAGAIIVTAAIIAGAIGAK